MKYIVKFARALTIFLIALRHDPEHAHEKITEILGIRG